MNEVHPIDYSETTGKIPEIPNTTDPHKIPPIYGWTCNKCGNVYSPYIKGCINCNKSNSEYPITPPTWC